MITNEAARLIAISTMSHDLEIAARALQDAIANATALDMTATANVLERINAEVGSIGLRSVAALARIIESNK